MNSTVTALRSLTRAMFLGFTRDRGALIFTIAIPVLFLVLFGSIYKGSSSPRVTVVEVGRVPLLDREGVETGHGAGRRRVGHGVTVGSNGINPACPWLSRAPSKREKPMPRAVRFDEYGDIDVLRVEEVPRPVPGSGQGVVKDTLSAVRRASTMAASSWGTGSSEGASGPSRPPLADSAIERRPVTPDCVLLPPRSPASAMCSTPRSATPSAAA